MTLKEEYWKRFQLDDKPQTCYICGDGVTVDNCGAMTWHYGETIVCCDNRDDLRHFERFVKQKKLNWIRFEEPFQRGRA